MSDNEQESESREMVADILAEYRNDVDAMDRGWLYKPTTEYVRRLLDRIDAAWKRQEQCYLDQIRDAVNMIGHERFVAEHPSVGNASTMREALIIAKKAICHYAEHICQSLSWEGSDIQSNCADVLCAHRELCEAKTAINAALAAPARNCDVEYEDQVGMYDAFKDWCKAKGHTMEPMLAYDAFDWLLAPAAERKGEDR